MIRKEYVEKAYSKFLADERSDHLKQILREPNIFSILKVSHYEIRHSNFLAWLLNPHESHGLGTAFLERTLRNLALLKGVDTLSIFDIPRLVENKIQVYREWNNIDILIELNDLVITIENKIYSGENGNQLANYKRKIEESFPRKKQLFIYLTPLGKPSSMPGVYFDYSYLSIIENLEALKRVNSKTISASTLSYISDYIQNIKRHVMGNSEANLLAKKLYYSHKDLFDFVIANRPDPCKELQHEFEKKVKSINGVLGSPGPGYIRFLSEKLNSIIPRDSTKGWPLKEAFLFEIYLLYPNNKLRIYCTLPPASYPSREKLKTALNAAFDVTSNNDDVTLNNDGWIPYFDFQKEYDLIEIVSKGKDSITSFVDSLWPSVETMIAKAEYALIPLLTPKEINV